MWTKFMDMHSGGGCKEEPYEVILIEAPEEEAKVIFYNLFRHNPERVTCTCCGDDYAIQSNESLEQLTGYLRGCEWNFNLKQYIEKPRTSCSYRTLSEFLILNDVMALRKEQIKDSERIGLVPTQGYVWVGEDNDSN